MPYRPAPPSLLHALRPGAELRCRHARGFRSSGGLGSGDGKQHVVAQGQNHYERLGLRHDASHAEIKKSFYALSKSHHPDHNPSNPHAAHSFALLSESYRILSDPSHRAAYDRDVLRLHHHHHHHNPRGASYHSTNPAGGRSPSGLSRRRGTFRGPPPSFYRSGGWGEQAEKRRAAHEESTGAHHHGSGTSHASHSAGASHADPWSYAHEAGMGPGSDPFHRPGAAPHFDRHGHGRTQTREDQKRSQRVRRAMGVEDAAAEGSVAGHFFIVTGILAATILAPLVYMQFLRLGKTSKREQ